MIRMFHDMEPVPADRNEWGWGLTHYRAFPDVAKDEFGVPEHPFWRGFFFRRLVDPEYPIPFTKFDESSASGTIPLYYCRLTDVWWRHHVDLRSYPCNAHATLFDLPFPPASIVPTDADGIPFNFFWMLWYFIKQMNPTYFIPPYDKTGRPLWDQYQKTYDYFQAHPLTEGVEVSYIEHIWEKSGDQMSRTITQPFDRQQFIRERPFFVLPPIDKSTGSYKRLGAPNTLIGLGKKKVDDRFMPKAYDFRANTPPRLPTTLLCPTVPELAIAYLTHTYSENAVGDQRLLADKNRFPKGFTNEHRDWLIACINPPVLAYLQNHLPPTNAILQKIIAESALPLKSSPYSLL